MSSAMFNNISRQYPLPNEYEEYLKKEFVLINEYKKSKELSKGEAASIPGSNYINSNTRYYENDNNELIDNVFSEGESASVPKEFQ